MCHTAYWTDPILNTLAWPVSNRQSHKLLLQLCHKRDTKGSPFMPP